MGNTSDSSSSYLLSQSYEWKHRVSLGYCELVKDKSRGVIGERYICYIENLDRDLQIYEFRARNIDCLVGVWNVERREEDYLCGSSLTIVSVVTERIPYRLIDLGHVGYTQGLYIMGKCLKGAELVWKEIGSIQYDENMICFTPQGQVKIWINENLSLNSSKSQVNFTEDELVLFIMEIVEVRMGGDKMREYFYAKKKLQFLDFRTATLFVEEMKGHAYKVNFISLPSIVVENFQEENIKIKRERLKSERNNHHLQKKVPFCILPLPPKSLSESRQRRKLRQHLLTPTPTKKHRDINNFNIKKAEEIKPTLPPNMKMKNIIHSTLSDKKEETWFSSSQVSSTLKRDVNRNQSRAENSN